ncbi:MAG: bis(5'-nucleosyl)-tetraphosphatase (symmetrical) YqeK [Treponema sp.]|nr:bis(5'-nucleosyl)-tetraphosphatase (symmetrical) YqeK [Treponema sp.]
MKLAILGGSFNPVHLGHLYLAGEALALGFDRILLVPAFESPFKPGSAGPGPAETGVRAASPQDRLEMLAASIPADPSLGIDDGEIRREGVSYTIDTVRDIIRRYHPSGKPGLILGDDLAAGFDRWKDAGEIAALTEIIIARRTSAAPVSFPYPFRQMDNALMDLSSAGVRRRIAAGESWRYLVPAGARFIIEDRGLYGCASRDSAGDRPQGGQQLIALVETTLRSMLSPARFLHSRGTALVAADICGRFGLDREKGYLAGIAHDMAKELPVEELKRLARKEAKTMTVLEQEKPSLLHAKAAVWLLRDRFGIEDEDILEAVRNHTLGRPGMRDLAKVVYIADKTEPFRRDLRPEFRDLEAWDSLDSLVTAVLENTVAWFHSRAVAPSAETVGLLAAMHRRNPG